MPLPQANLILPHEMDKAGIIAVADDPLLRTHYEPQSTAIGESYRLRFNQLFGGLPFGEDWNARYVELMAHRRSTLWTPEYRQLKDAAAEAKAEAQNALFEIAMTKGDGPELKAANLRWALISLAADSVCEWQWRQQWPAFPDEDQDDIHGLPDPHYLVGA